jgi:hypothetical protein
MGLKRLLGLMRSMSEETDARMREIAGKVTDIFIDEGLTYVETLSVLGLVNSAVTLDMMQKAGFMRIEE